MSAGGKVIDLSRSGDARDAVRDAVDCLVHGGVVALPTETVYGLAAMALNEPGVNRLWELKQRPTDKPMSLAIKNPGEVVDYVPGISRTGRRLAHRCWPGPVTLVFRDGLKGGLVERLPSKVRQSVSPDGSVGLRVCAHPVVAEILRLLAGPIVLTSANLSGQPDSISGDQVREALNGTVSLLLDDGPTRYGQASTVVEVQGNAWRILRQGVVPEKTLRWMTGCSILFVCTGNTCRSPMAEALARALLAKRAGCAPDDLAEHGWHVASAGVAAVLGGGPTSEAIDAVRQHGASLNDHISQPVTDHMVLQADHIFTMTAQHREAILLEWPEAADRVQLLAVDGSDVLDPIGGTGEMYRRCAELIDHHLRQRLAKIDG